MENPLNSLGYTILNASLDADTPNGGRIGKLSRRGFIAATAVLSSCSAAKPLAQTQSQQKAKPEAQPVKTPANTAYRTPPVKGPVPRNPDMNLSSNFSRGAGVTFTRVQVAGKYIAITYDDGPTPKNTPRLLDMLRARNIKATFYVIGRSVDVYPQVLRRTVAEGHEIGNHSYTHRLLSKLSNKEVVDDLRRCKDAVARAAGVEPRTMRPPYGGLLQSQRALVMDEFGYPTILWSVDPLDWKRPGAGVITSRILAGTKPGGIVLAHDLHSQTVDAMPATLDGLLSQGYQFVTVSQLIAMQVEATASQAPAASSNI